MKRRDDSALFGYVVGPHAMKRFLHPPVQPLWQAVKGEDGYRFETPSGPERPFAFVGMRSCDIRAMQIQDRVFEQGAYKDTHYQARRADAFVVAVNCAQAGGTCFCASMKTGPKAKNGLRSGADRTRSCRRSSFPDRDRDRARAGVSWTPCRNGRRPPADVEAAATMSANTAASMHRQMPAGEVKDLLLRNLEHPRWDEVAERCLSCGNCTMVCPTCFCTQSRRGHAVHRRGASAERGNGLPASASISPMFTAAASGIRPARAIASG